MNDLLDNHNILHGTGTELLRRQKDSGDCQAKEVAGHLLRHRCRGTRLGGYCLDCGQYVFADDNIGDPWECFRDISGVGQEEEEKCL